MKNENRDMSKLGRKQETKDENELSSVFGRSNNNVNNSDEHSAGFRFCLEGETVRFNLREGINASDLNKAGKDDYNDKSHGRGMGNGQPAKVNKK